MSLFNGILHIFHPLICKPETLSFRFLLFHFSWCLCPLSHPFVYTLGAGEFFLNVRTVFCMLSHLTIWISLFDLNLMDLKFEMNWEQEKMHYIYCKVLLNCLYRFFCSLCRSRPVWERIGLYSILVHCYLTCVAAEEKEAKEKRSNSFHFVNAASSTALDTLVKLYSMINGKG